MKKLILLFLFTIAGSYAQTAKDLVKFTAKIQNRNSDSIVFNGASKFRKAIHINKQGVFTDSFNAPAGLYELTDGVEYTLVYLKNGYDLQLNMDAKKFDESIVYKGKGSKENNYLAQKALLNEEIEPKVFAAKDEKTINEAVADFSKRLNEKLNDKDLDPDFKVVGIQLLNNETAQMLGQAKGALSMQKLAGNPSPQFEYENYAGGKTKLEDFKGKYVYIDVWATWCGPCRGEIPFLQKVEEKYKGKNIEFVSISIDERKDFEKWKKMINDKSLGGTQVFADNNWGSAFVQAYGINGIPRFILIDPSGNVVSADAARPSDPALQAQLDKLVN